MNRALPEGTNLRDAEGSGQPDFSRRADAGAYAHDSLDNPHAISDGHVIDHPKPESFYDRQMRVFGRIIY